MEHMGTIDQTIFQLIRASLFTDETVDLMDWDAVFAEMKAQAIATLPGEWLKRHCASDVSSWRTFCIMQYGRWVRVMHEQDQLLQLFARHDIPCVVIKGSASAMAYPNPALRTMGDVDILVKRADLDRAAMVMEQDGFRLCLEKDSSIHHYSYIKGDVVFELHHRLSVIRESDERLLSLFENGIDQRVYAESNGYRFPVLPEVLNGLSLMFHINHHLREGLGLRQIIDWMMYVNARSDEERNELGSLLRETGMEKLALTVTVLCQRYLGLRRIVEDDGNNLCEKLLAYIMEKGNFGRKAGIEGKIASFSLTTKGPKSFFRRLQDNGMYRWKAAQKHTILRPFAWIYQLFWIIGELFKNMKSPARAIAYQMQGLKQRKLIKALGLAIDSSISYKPLPDDMGQ